MRPRDGSEGGMAGSRTARVDDQVGLGSERAADVGTQQPAGADPALTSSGVSAMEGLPKNDD